MESARTVRVGLLICGTVSEPLEAIHGGYYEIYTRYWKKTTPANSNAKVQIDRYNIKQMHFPDQAIIDEYDIFMVTGSATSAYDDSIPWVRELLAFLKDLIENHPKVKLCGICFGHQISLQEIHRDHVPLESLSSQFTSGELELVGSTGPTGNQGLIKFNQSSAKNSRRTAQDIQVLTLQGHPEFTEPIITGLLRERVDLFGLSTVTDYWGHEGVDDDDEPANKEGTGRRWKKTDGLDIVSQVLWKMVGVSPSIGSNDEDENKERTSEPSRTQRHRRSTISRVQHQEKVYYSRWWAMAGPRLTHFSNQLAGIYGASSWW
ncbi:hypothetical protein NP233_g7493 [Leucocoprinus birnbaumii]|uniref:Glutamine amidotransferase domain-containing protein n=1 Tax=Leucocoprinus birnbaumii TaxID=56174 RepID=A0AAD5YNY6_9AGAR|nr:hypothetical protein NP233_g7493 [Leucocoprinus birnbaumii]